MCTKFFNFYRDQEQSMFIILILIFAKIWHLLFSKLSRNKLLRPNHNRSHKPLHRIYLLANIKDNFWACTCMSCYSNRVEQKFHNILHTKWLYSCCIQYGSTLKVWVHRVLLNSLNHSLGELSCCTVDLCLGQSFLYLKHWKLRNQQLPPARLSDNKLFSIFTTAFCLWLENYT